MEGTGFPMSKESMSMAKVEHLSIHLGDAVISLEI